MNIIQVCPYDLSIPGGVQTHITHLSNQLVKKNHRVMVVAPSLKKSGFGRKFDCEVNYVTDSKRIGIWGTSIDITRMDKDERKIFRKTMEDFNPDVIHFHTIWNPFMPTQILNMAPKSVKKVATFHDTPPDFGIGKYIGSNLMKLGVRYYFPKIDEIISVSKTQSAAMGMNDENSPDNFRIIPNGIDATVERSDSSEKENVFRLIFIGRFEERKGLKDILEIYKNLKQNHTNRKIELKVLGNGPLMGMAKKYVVDHSLEDISFYPNTSDEEKSEYLGQSSLLVAPSLYGESFGIVLLEGMAMGVKVVGYGNSGYLNLGREYGIENFPTPGDKDGLYKIIEKHMTDPRSTDHLIRKGFEIAEKHDWKNITKQIEQVYLRKQ